MPIHAESGKAGRQLLEHTNLRMTTTILYVTLATLLIACERQESTTAIDPETGYQCFESRRAALPPGTQYEGIDKANGEHITIRIMNGVDVTTIECALNPDGSIRDQSESAQDAP